MTAAYPVPDRPIRDIYTTSHERTNTPGTWDRLRVSVFRNDHDGTQAKVAEYGRNYDMLRTFEPFRQLRDGQWHDYALISDKYTRLAVLDLATGEIMATEPYPAATEKQAEVLNKHHPESPVAVGDPLPSIGFCPAEFYVPDFYDDFKRSDYLSVEAMEKDIKSTVDALAYSGTDERQLSFAEDWAEEYRWSSSGQWGVYAGCIWGDDSSYKLRYVDLSRVSEGIVTTDERFGYVELSNSRLKDSIAIAAETKSITVNIPVMFDVETGKAPYFKYTAEYINWERDND